MKKIILFFTLTFSCHLLWAQEASDIKTIVLKKGSITSVSSSLKEFIDGPLVRNGATTPTWKEVNDQFVCDAEACDSGCVAKGEMIISGFLRHRVLGIAAERSQKYTKDQAFVARGCSPEEKQEATGVYLKLLRSEENELRIINSAEPNAYLGMSGCFSIELLIAYNAKTNNILTAERSYIKNGDDMSCYHY